MLSVWGDPLNQGLFNECQFHSRAISDTATLIWPLLSLWPCDLYQRHQPSLLALKLSFQRYFIMLWYFPSTGTRDSQKIRAETGWPDFAQVRALKRAAGILSLALGRSFLPLHYRQFCTHLEYKGTVPRWKAQIGWICVLPSSLLYVQLQVQELDCSSSSINTHQMDAWLVELILQPDFKSLPILSLKICLSWWTHKHWRQDFLGWACS